MTYRTCSLYLPAGRLGDVSERQRYRCEADQVWVVNRTLSLRCRVHRPAVGFSDD